MNIRCYQWNNLQYSIINTIFFTLILFRVSYLFMIIYMWYVFLYLWEVATYEKMVKWKDCWTLAGEGKGRGERGEGSGEMRGERWENKSQEKRRGKKIRRGGEEENGQQGQHKIEDEEEIDWRKRGKKRLDMGGKPLRVIQLYCTALTWMPLSCLEHQY